MEILEVSINEFLILTAIILILVDVFFNSDITTHIAYIMLTFVAAKSIEVPLLYKIVLAILIWFSFVVFHYTLWRKFIEKINDKYIAPSLHSVGIKTLIGQVGIIKKIDGKMFISINGELHYYELKYNIEAVEGEEVTVRAVKKRILII